MVGTGVYQGTEWYISNVVDIEYHTISRPERRATFWLGSWRQPGVLKLFLGGVYYYTTGSFTTNSTAAIAVAAAVIDLLLYY